MDRDAANPSNNTRPEHKLIDTCVLLTISLKLPSQLLHTHGNTQKCVWSRINVVYVHITTCLGLDNFPVFGEGQLDDVFVAGVQRPACMGSVLCIILLEMMC